MTPAAAVEALSALAQPTRLAAFRLIVTAGPEGVPAGEVASRLGAPANTMSTHLAILARAGLIEARRAGRHVRYALQPAQVAALLGFLVQDCCGGDPALCAPLTAALAGPSACGGPAP